MKLATAGGVWNCFARKSGVLTQGGTCKSEVKAGQTYALRLKAIQTDMHAHSAMKTQ